MVSIFIVEDELSIARMYQMYLELNGFNICGIATNGEQAVQMYKIFSPKPDIVIMDYRIPLKDGIEASKEILLYDPNAKIIFASADLDIKEHAKQIGVLSFKAKPFNNDKLLRNIDKVLGLGKVSVTN